MKKGQSSKTAAAAAALRANHCLYAEQPVFKDPYAFEMTNQLWQRALSFPLLSKVMNLKVVNRGLGLLTAQVVGRSRYAEDQLEKAIQQGMTQYVLVGAGLDSFILREAKRYKQLKIFELDHPDTQRLKKQKLAQFGDIAEQFEFVAIDFEKESIAQALTRSGYQQDYPAFYTWLGTTHYLQAETTLQTLKSIAGFAAAQSEIVFDYSIEFSRLRSLEKIGAYALAELTKLLGEPLIGQFDSADLHQKLEQMGFTILEDVSGDALSALYFKARTDHIQATSATHMLHLVLK